MNDLRCRLATRFDELEEVASAWDRLARAHPRPQAFYLWAWHRAAWSAFGDQRRLCTPLVFAGEHLVGILPLAEERGLVGFLGRPHADYGDLLCDGASPNDVLHIALEALERAGFRRALLDHVPEGALLLAAAEGTRLERRTGDPCPALVVRERAELDEVLGKKSLKRHERALDKHGALAFERIRSRDALRAALPEFFEQHEARRALAGDRSLFQSDRSRRFYEALADELDPAETLHFTVLRSGGAAAAFHFGFVMGGVLTWYKPTIDVDLWDLGPGEVLLKRLIEDVRDAGLRELDFTRGDEAFKQRFANVQRRCTNLHLTARGLRGATERAWARAENAVRGRPALRRTAKRVRAFACELARVLRKHGPLRLGAMVVTRAWRRWVFAHDEVLVFTREREAAVPRASGPELRIEAGSLARLAAQAASHADVLDGDRLQNARKRLKSGDRLVLAWLGHELAHVAWLGRRDEIVATEVGTEVRIPLTETATVIYDCWTPAAMRGCGVYPVVLQHMVELADTVSVWIYCHARNRASIRGIEKAGFGLRWRMCRIGRFGRARRSWVEPASTC